MVGKNLLEAKLAPHLTYLGGTKVIAGNLFGEEIFVFRDMNDYKKNRENKINSKAPEGADVFVAFNPVQKKIAGKDYVFVPVRYYCSLAIQG